jgi:alpha-glucosidase
MSKVPVTWDETKCINASVSHYVTVARKHGSDWYLGSMTDFTSRSFDIPLNFLEEGQYSVTIFIDGINADSRAEDYSTETFTVDNKSILNLKLASGGGFACRITKL